MVRQGVKSESAHGLLTPYSSFPAPQQPVTLKRESIDLTSVDDIEEVPYHATRHQHPTVEDEGYDSIIVAEQQRRSTAVSARTSQSLPLHPIMAPSAPQLPTGGEGLQVVGRDVNRLVSLIDKLRRIGLKSVDGALPELVLCGDQSAGKSSLMGAIAEINLPKGNSMCTRCPTNIKTSPAAEWSCTVSLQEDHTYDTTRKPGTVYAFPNWTKRDGMSSSLFKTIDDKAELEEVLTWAQIAILNPLKHHQDFVPGTREQALKKEQNDTTTEAQFSPNVIAVEIRGPSLPALSFFDLPGLFQAAEDPRQQFLVKVFEDLTKKYIQHSNAIIICTITMQNDPGLSRTKALISKCKAEDKCLGVLTMPDRMQGDASHNTHRDYDNILRNKTYVLPRGYYVTKQPGPDSELFGDSNNYHALARQEEEEYFDNHARWGPGGAWSEFRDRCGTSTIQKYLSKEFAKQILHSVPNLTQNINEQMDSVERNLSSLPETPHDKVQHIVRERLSEFSYEVQRILGGSSEGNLFQSDWRRLCDNFLKATEVMRPGCVVNHQSDRIKEVITIDDSDNDSVMSEQPSSSSGKRLGEGYDSSQIFKRPRVNDTAVRINLPSTPSTPSRYGVKRENGSSQYQMPAPAASPAVRKLKNEEIGPFRQPYLDSGHRAMTIGDIRQSIEQRGRAGFPGIVSHRVKEDYALQAVNPWDGPLQTFIDSTFEMLRSQILTALSTVMKDHILTDLYKKSKTMVEEFLSMHEQEQRAASIDFYEVEKSRLFTINEEAFERHEAEALKILKATRRQTRVQFYAERYFRPKMNGDFEKENAAREKFKSEVKDEQLGPDPFEKELQVAAYIRGYYTTARYRFTDSVCANMNSKYFGKISKEIRYMLEQKLQVDHDSETTCRALLESNALISERRQQLKNRKAQLEEFSKTLDELRNDTFAEDPTHHGMDAGIINGDEDEEMADNLSNTTIPYGGSPRRHR